MNDAEEKVILVNENGEPAGTAGKLEVHQKGWLHLAFSVFLFNKKGQVLLHKRADGKYHSAGLWTNACCSHPRPGESILNAAQRRLKEEMGLDVSLRELFVFRYMTRLDNGLTEHELDHVLMGITDERPHPDASEVAEWKWLDPEATDRLLAENPGAFTFWFREAWPRVKKLLNQPR